MKNKSSGRSAHCGRMGLTLIEVLASIVLLSTLLVSMLVSLRRHTLQTLLASETIRATEALDLQLVAWSELEEGYPRSGRGVLRPSREFQWTAHTEKLPGTHKPWDMELIVLNVRAAAKPNTDPLVTVKLVTKREETSRRPSQ